MQCSAFLPHQAIAATLTLVAALLIAGPASAQSCSMVNQGPAKVELKSSEPVTLPAARIEPCEGAKVLQGTVVACVLDARGRSLCQTYRQGEKMTWQRLRTNGDTKGPWYTLSQILRGSPDRTSAVSRGGSDGNQPLPVGPVVLLEPTLAPAFDTHPGLRGVASIALHRGSASGPLVATLSPTGARSLPGTRLESDTRYAWVARNAQGQILASGEFNLLPDDQRDALRAEAARVVKDAPNDPLAQAVMLAGALADMGCNHEAAERLRAAGVAVVP